MRSRIGRSRHGARRGQALVETALALPLILLVLLGIVDFGRAVYAYNTMSNAAREAARIAIVDPDVDRIAAVAAGHAVGLDVTVDVAFHKPQPNADPSTNEACSPVKIGCIAIVTVDSTYVAATPIIGALVGEIELRGKTEMPVENAP